MIRRYEQQDIQVLLDLIEQHLSTSSMKDIRFSRTKMSDLLHGNLRNLTFFVNVAVKDGQVVGGFCASLSAYIFSHEVMAVDNIFYIHPDHRDTQLATELVESYIEWAKNRKVRQIRLMNVTGLRPETFEKFAQKFGFRYVGSVHLMEA